jgi:hypothetical protein
LKQLANLKQSNNAIMQIRITFHIRIVGLFFIKPDPSYNGCI